MAWAKLPKQYLGNNENTKLAKSKNKLAKQMYYHPTFNTP